MKSNHVVGLSVVAIDTGKHIGQVQDIIINQQWYAEGVILDSKRWFTHSKWIAWKHIVAIGDDALTIPSEEVMEHVEEQIEENSYIWIKNEQARLAGMQVLTTNGRSLGTIEDVYLEKNMGKKVTGFELSDGFLSDLQDGRKFLPLMDEINVGEEAVIVPAGSEHTVKEVVTTL
ncbi:PRC-barrel domain-containing protein [Longirhabdus pacifica]|uniref:PRC-barrel domain-containing protein n=1 Tax=Longirhabdus pacifica TaxID=2305227 RepID=UPI001008830B|nr:PRC-barrel domain-containing protein [Longirhabdus pacifica]